MFDIQGIDWNEVWKKWRTEHAFLGRSSAFWDARAQTFAEHMLSKRGHAYAEKLLQIINPEQDWTIVDMGCGAGTLAVPFSEHVKAITAVDFSGTMLEILKERCREGGIANVRTIKASWDDDWDKAGIGLHDVAIASRSLAVEDLRHAMIKLNRVAKKRVYIVTFVRRNEEEKGIFEAVGREPNTGPDYICNYNLLYQMGIHANVTFVTEKGPKTFENHDEALEFLKRKVDGITAEEKKKLRTYLERHLIHDMGRWRMNFLEPMKWAVIWWEKEHATNM